MKTAISLPDDVFERAENTAKRLKLSRSELYARALSEFLARHTADEVTRAINEAIAEAGQPRDEASVRVSTRRLAATEW